MDMVKLVKGDRVIERRKVDYENNINIWNLRGWKLDDGKPKAPPKPNMVCRRRFGCNLIDCISLFESVDISLSEIFLSLLLESFEVK